MSGLTGLFRHKSFLLRQGVHIILEGANRVIARTEEVYGEFPQEDLLGLTGYFHTQFTVIRDHTNKNLYVRGIYNPNLTSSPDSPRRVDPVAQLS
jgi:hypothetical protein